MRPAGHILEAPVLEQCLGYPDTGSFLSVSLNLYFVAKVYKTLCICAQSFYPSFSLHLYLSFSVCIVCLYLHVCLSVCVCVCVSLLFISIIISYLLKYYFNIQCSINLRVLFLYAIEKKRYGLKLSE